MARTDSPGRGQQGLLAAAVVVGVVTFGVLGALLIRSAADRPAPQPGPKAVGGHVVPGTGSLRTLVVKTQNDRVSSAGGALEAMLLEGTMPAGQMVATVMSDENCQPDGEGVSHCLNRLRFDDGTMMAVRHNHRMGDVPCLSPNERVIVEPSA